MNKKKVLITGATGFLGSVVLKKMLEKNFKVTAIVRDERKLSDQIIKKNPTNLIVKKGDITNVNLKGKSDFDIILHSAAETSKKKNTLKTDVASNIIQGTVNMLRLASEKNVKKFIYISSGAVYGMHSPLKRGWKESHGISTSHIEEKATYAFSKKLSEILVFNWASKHKNRSYLILRPFSLYGEGLKSEYGFAIKDFIDCRLNNNNIFLQSNGKLIKRSYLHVEDYSSWIFKLIHEDYENITLNIGSKNIYSLYELANIIANIEIKGLSKVQVVNPANKILSNYIPNLNKLTKLGFKEKQSFEHRLKEIILNKYENTN